MDKQIEAIMHNVRELRVQTAMHTGESTGNLDVLERRIEDGIRVLAGLQAVQPELPEVERLAAQSAPTEPPQEFESAQGRALASAWAEGWAQCRDAEYVGEEAESEAFNQSATLAQCLHADQTRFQGGLSNDELRRAWSAKLPNVIPTDEQLTAFALGIEAAAQPSQAPVVQAVQGGRPPLPEGKAVIRCVADTEDGGWVADFDCEGPLSHEPKEGDVLFTTDQMHAYFDAALAAKGQA